MAASWNNGSDATRFIYDPISGNLIGEIDTDGTTFSQYALYTWGVTLLAQKRGSTVSYYHFDGNGSVRALSNSSKTITDTYSYNAFGEVISSSGSTVNPFRWLGGAGIYDDGARGSVFGLNIIGSGLYVPSTGSNILRRPELGFSFVNCTKKEQQTINASLNYFCKVLLPRLRNCLENIACSRCSGENLYEGLSSLCSGSGSRIIVHCASSWNFHCILGSCGFQSGTGGISICPGAFAAPGCGPLFCTIIHELMHFFGKLHTSDAYRCLKQFGGCRESID